MAYETPRAKGLHIVKYQSQPDTLVNCEWKPKKTKKTKKTKKPHLPARNKNIIQITNTYHASSKALFISLSKAADKPSVKTVFISHKISSAWLGKEKDNINPFFNTLFNSRHENLQDVS